MTNFKRTARRMMMAMLSGAMLLPNASIAILADEFETSTDTSAEVSLPVAPQNSTVYEIKLQLKITEEALANATGSSKDAIETQKKELEAVLARYEKTPMYRVYNPNSGEHFYTASEEERDHLINVGWKDESIGWYAPVNGGQDVFRLYNANSGDHHYTLNPEERSELIRMGWKDEGIGWKSLDETDVNRQPVYRQYNPNEYACNHNYTTSPTERETLVKMGWIDENIGFYGIQEYSVIKDGKGTKFYDPDKMEQLTGWVKFNLDTYYLDPANEGYMVTGPAKIDGKFYLFDDQGRKLDGKQTYKGETYYLDSKTGEARTGYQRLTKGETGTKARIVYLDEEGKIMKDVDIDGMTFNENGDKSNLTPSETLWLDIQSVYDKAGRDLGKCFDWTAQNLAARKYDPSWLTPPADSAMSAVEYMAYTGLKDRTANTFIYASVFEQLASNLGYDATVVKGAIKTVNGQTEHGWVEINIDGKTYVFDPTLYARKDAFPRDYCYMQPKDKTTFVYITQ